MTYSRRVDRRAVTAAILSTLGTGAAATAAVAQQVATPPLPVRDWLHTVAQPPFAIPLDYLGLHSDHGLDGVTAAPTYPYDGVRSHDANGPDGQAMLQWARIETAPGHYDWTSVDRWIAIHPAKTRIWVLFGTPTFYQKYPAEAFPYPQLPGGGSPPREARHAANFIAALLRRHPGRIAYVEVWNEPNFGWSGTDPTRHRWQMKKPGFFTGTASELASLAYAVKRVLPADVKLLAGAWEGQDSNTTQINSMLRFSSAPDGAGGIGRQHVDALSVHAYTYNNDPNTLVTVLRNYTARFKQAGYPAAMERLVTELGAEAPGHWEMATPPLAERVQAVKRWCMIPAALGYKAAYLYKHSLKRTLGDPQRNLAIAAAISEMRDGLRGKQLVQAAVLQDATVWMSFADATSLRA